MSYKNGQVWEFKYDFVSSDTYQFSGNVQQADTTQIPDSFVSEPLYQSLTPVGQETDNFQYVFGNLTDIQSHPSLQAMTTISEPTREVPLQLPSSLRRDENESKWESDGQVIRSTRSDNFDNLCGELREKQYKEKPQRSRASEMHSLCEKRRRERIKGKMKALKELLPGRRKYRKDSALLLDDAIEYLKTLRLQIEMIYRQRGFICQVPSMLPTGFQTLQTPQFAPSAHMSPGMGMAGLCNCGAISYIQNSLYGNLPFPQVRLPSSLQTAAAATSSTMPIFNSGLSDSSLYPDQEDVRSKDTGN